MNVVVGVVGMVGAVPGGWLIISPLGAARRSTRPTSARWA